MSAPVMRPSREECGLPPIPKESDGMVGTYTLKERGWTEAGIKRFLGEADKLRPNPHYRSGPPARLFALARVEAVEATDEWQTWRAEAQVRSERGKSVAIKRKAALLAEIRSRPVLVQVYDDAELDRLAVSHRNMVQAERAWDYFDPATVESATRETLDRWAVNWLRHGCTRYDDELDALYAQVGRQEGAALIRRRTLDAIAATYPRLAAECERQR